MAISKEAAELQALNTLLMNQLCPVLDSKQEAESPEKTQQIHLLLVIWAICGQKIEIFERNLAKSTVATIAKANSIVPSLGKTLLNLVVNHPTQNTDYNNAKSELIKSLLIKGASIVDPADPKLLDKITVLVPDAAQTIIEAIRVTPAGVSEIADPLIISLSDLLKYYQQILEIPLATTATPAQKEQRSVIQKHVIQIYEFVILHSNNAKNAALLEMQKSLLVIACALVNKDQVDRLLDIFGVEVVHSLKDSKNRNLLNLVVDKYNSKAPVTDPANLEIIDLIKKLLKHGAAFYNANASSIYNKIENDFRKKIEDEAKVNIGQTLIERLAELRQEQDLKEQREKQIIAHKILMENLLIAVKHYQKNLDSASQISQLPDYLNKIYIFLKKLEATKWHKEFEEEYEKNFNEQLIQLRQSFVVIACATKSLDTLRELLAHKSYQIEINNITDSTGKVVVEFVYSKFLSSDVIAKDLLSELISAFAPLGSNMSTLANFVNYATIVQNRFRENNSKIEKHDEQIKVFEKAIEIFNQQVPIMLEHDSALVNTLRRQDDAEETIKYLIHYAQCADKKLKMFMDLVVKYLPISEASKRQVLQLFNMPSIQGLLMDESSSNPAITRGFDMMRRASSSVAGVSAGAAVGVVANGAAANAAFEDTEDDRKEGDYPRQQPLLS